MELVPRPGETWRQLEFSRDGRHIETVSFTPEGALRQIDAGVRYHQMVPLLIEELTPDLIPPGQTPPVVQALWKFTPGWYFWLYQDGEYVGGIEILPPQDQGWTGPDLHLFSVIGRGWNIEVNYWHDYELFSAGKPAPFPRVEVACFIMRKRFRYDRVLRDVLADGIRQLLSSFVPEPGVVVVRTAHGARPRLFRSWGNLREAAVWRQSPFYGGLDIAYLRGDATMFKEATCTFQHRLESRYDDPDPHRRPYLSAGWPGHEARSA